MYSGRWSQRVEPRLLPSQLTTGSSAVIKQYMYLCTAGAVNFAQDIKPSQCSELGGFWDKDVPSLFLNSRWNYVRDVFDEWSKVQYSESF
jgi:hypothetical protein